MNLKKIAVETTFLRQQPSVLLCAYYTYYFLDPGSSQKDEGNTTGKSGTDWRSQKVSDSNKGNEGTGEKSNDVTGKKTDPKISLNFGLRKEG